MVASLPSRWIFKYSSSMSVNLLIALPPVVGMSLHTCIQQGHGNTPPGEESQRSLGTPAFLSNQGNSLLSVYLPRRFPSWYLEQAREAREGSQWDHIKVDQVQLREWQRGERLLGGFHARTFEHQYHSAWFVRAGVELAAD